MKRLEEMSRTELLQLDDTQIETIIDLECAYAGAPLSIDKPLYSEVPEIPEPDVIYYEVAGMKLQDKKEAYALADYINGLHSRCDTSYDYDIPGYGKYDYLHDGKKIEPAIVEAAKTYSKVHYSELKETIRQRATAEKENEELMREYNAKQKERADIVNMVYAAIRQARTEAYEIEEKAKLYTRYLYLAGGDKVVAARFYFEHFGGDQIPDEIMEKAESIIREREETNE